MGDGASSTYLTLLGARAFPNLSYFAIHRGGSRAALMRWSFSRRRDKDIRLVTVVRRSFVGKDLPPSIITLLSQTCRQAISSVLGMADLRVPLPSSRET